MTDADAMTDVDPEKDKEVEAGADRTLRGVAVSILAFTAIYAVTAIALFAARVAFGVVVGGIIACLNFVVLARIGRSITKKGRDAAIWGAVYLVKVAALFGGVALLLHSGWVSGLGVVVGFTALLPGIVVGGLLAGKAAGPQAPADPTARK
jgi:hypothetical protein